MNGNEKCAPHPQTKALKEFQSLPSPVPTKRKLSISEITPERINNEASSIYECLNQVTNHLNTPSKRCNKYEQKKPPPIK